MLFLFNLKISLIEKSKIINHMFVRIVKLSFHEENIPLFLENFESIKERIRCAPGSLLELYQDKENSIFFTYSYWDTEEDLENYRILSFSMKFGLYEKIIQRQT
jgi:hypothetical protein